MTSPLPEDSLATIDLSGDEKPETGGQAAGRIIGGLAMFLIFGLLTIACAVAFVLSLFNPQLWDWADLIGDGLLFIGAITLGLSIVGFELMRRGRKSRASAFESAANILGATGLADVETVDERPSNSTSPIPPKPIL
jgi:hypothetical protein